MLNLIPWRMFIDKPLKKPLLRGYLHQEAFFVSLGASLLLIAKSSSRMAFVASLIYALGLLFLFGVSAIYHRPHWNPKSRALMKRLDHSAIFVLIACTVTPICLLALNENDGHRLLTVIWSAAVIGILQSVFWVTAPKFLTAFLYVFVGWLVFPYVEEFKGALGNAGTALIIVGGLLYTVGAVFYALKKPKLSPTIFGYHELFHLFTIAGATLHFVMIYPLIK